ncbi:DMT family transporter [Acidithiobacillus sp. IBUN Pt1247-S3]
MTSGLRESLRHPGVLAALGAALLFGAGTPIAKILLHSVSPWLMAGLLYLGSGLALWIWRMLSGAKTVRLPRSEWPWLGGAILAGGVAGPVFLMWGLTGIPASNASLLLNAEGVFTALLAWFVFRENFDRRIALGMGAIVVGALILSWPGRAGFGQLWPSLSILAACFAWGLDNNLTRKISFADATWIAEVKGLLAAPVNLGLAFVLGEHLPAWPNVASAMGVGILAYGVSLALFVVALRHLGSARTGAYFSIAPFIGAALAVGLGAPVTFPLLAAGALMGLGVWLHLTEQHVHFHQHQFMAHSHTHVHDAHHQHAHDFPVTPGTRHNHWHEHAPLGHSHAHYPDIHHRHKH